MTGETGDTAREALRREHGVRPVSDDEEGTAADVQPRGVYGFTGSPALASPLFSARRYRNFEVHHLVERRRRARRLRHVPTRRAS